MQGKNILVVGGAGFVGSNLVKRILPRDPARIVVVDNFLSAEPENLPADPRVVVLRGSITDDAILDDIEDEFSHVFHLATFHGNQNSQADPLADHENNTLTTLKLFERLSRFRHLEKVVYSSAGCTVAPKTWGEAKPSQEDDPVSLWLDSPYQISKIVGEFYANYYFGRFKLPVVKARFQNVYGPGEVLGAGKWRGTPATIWRNVIPTFVYRALKQMPLIVDNRGLATRDFIFVEDIADGLIACATKGRGGEVYNLAAGEETQIAKLAELINAKAGNATPIEWGPRRDWDHSGRRLGSTAKAESELAFKTQVTFDEGLDRTIAWTRDNLPFIERCIAKHDPILAGLGAGAPA